MESHDRDEVNCGEEHVAREGTGPKTVVVLTRTPITIEYE